MDSHFGNVIWTNHVLKRLRERGISQSDAWATWRNPQESRRGKVPGSRIYYRKYKGNQIEVVAKQNERHEWVILSVWSRPIREHKENTLSFWKFMFRKLFH
jgi:hypothetical protein